MIESTITCDQTKQVLATGTAQSARLKPYLTLKGGLAIQLAPGEMSENSYGEPMPFHFLTEIGRTYSFRDATALADWIDDRVEEAGYTQLEAND